MSFWVVGYPCCKDALLWRYIAMRLYALKAPALPGTLPRLPFTKAKAEAYGHKAAPLTEVIGEEIWLIGHTFADARRKHVTDTQVDHPLAFHNFLTDTKVHPDIFGDRGLYGNPIRAISASYFHIKISREFNLGGESARPLIGIEVKISVFETTLAIEVAEVVKEGKLATRRVFCVELYTRRPVGTDVEWHEGVDVVFESRDALNYICCVAVVHTKVHRSRAYNEDSRDLIGVGKLR